MDSKLPQVDLSGAKPITIEVPKDLWRRARALALANGLTAKQVVAGLLQRYVEESEGKT